MTNKWKDNKLQMFYFKVKKKNKTSGLSSGYSSLYDNRLVAMLQFGTVLETTVPEQGVVRVAYIHTLPPPLINTPAHCCSAHPARVAVSHHR